MNSKLLLQNKFCFNHFLDLEHDNRIVDNQMLDWSLNPFGDNEWTFMLNRMEYLRDLDLSNDIEKDKAKELILNWIKNVSLEDSFVRTIDTAMRLSAWLKVVDIFEEEDYQLVTDSMIEQIAYLEGEWQDRHLLLNWGIIQVCSIIKVANYIDYPLDINLYQQRLMTMLKMQISTNGLHNESSTLYLFEVINQLNKIATIPEFKFVIPILNKAKATLVNLRLSNGTLVAWGDSDVHPAEQLFEYLNIADIEAADNTSDGIVHLHNGKFELMLFNTKHGGGHGHFMNNHIELCIDGKHVFTDCGRYSYTENQRRIQLKDFESHNTIQLATPICKPLSSWKNTGNKQVFPIQYYQLDGNDIIVSSWSNGRTVHNRCVWLNDDSCIVVDFVKDDYKQVFNCSNEVNIISNQLTIDSQKYCLKFSQPDKHVEAIQSEVYNQLNSIKRIETAPASGFQITSLCASDKDLMLENIYDSKGRKLENYQAISCGKSSLIISFEENLESSIPYYYRDNPFNFQIGLYQGEVLSVLKT